MKTKLLLLSVALIALLSACGGSKKIEETPKAEISIPARIQDTLTTRLMDTLKISDKQRDSIKIRTSSHMKLVAIDSNRKVQVKGSITVTHVPPREVEFPGNIFGVIKKVEGAKPNYTIYAQFEIDNVDSPRLLVFNPDGRGNYKFQMSTTGTIKYEGIQYRYIFDTIPYLLIDLKEIDALVQSRVVKGLNVGDLRKTAQNNPNTINGLQRLGVEPTDLTPIVEPLGGDSALVSWNTLSGATKYTITLYYDNKGGSKVYSPDVSDTNTSRIFRKLTPGYEYKMIVIAYGQGNMILKSEETILKL